MSIKVMTYVWEHSKHKGSELLTLLAIADHAHDDGMNAFPSINTLAQKTRMTERNVQFVLHKLEKSKELSIERGAGPKGCHLFRINMIQEKGEKISGGENFTPEKISGGENQRIEGGENQRIEGVKPISPKPSFKEEPSEKEPSYIPPTPKQGKRTKAQQQPITDYSPEFERFWTTFPSERRENKVECYQIWGARHLNSRIDEIVEKLERLKQTTWLRREAKYIPLSKTWLNQARYEDDLVPLETTAKAPPLSKADARLAKNALDARELQHELQEEMCHADERRGYRALLGRPSEHGRVVFR